MSARKLVRSLRDSGQFVALPAPSPWRSTILVFTAALFAGAVVYLGATHGVPALVKAMQKKPVPVHFAKPDDPAGRPL